MAVRGGDWMKRMVVSGCGVCLEDVQRAVVSESKKNLGFFFVATPSSMCLQHDCSTISEREGLTKAPNTHSQYGTPQRHRRTLFAKINLKGLHWQFKSTQAVSVS